MILVSCIVATVLLANPANPYVWIAIFVTLAYGAIGFSDEMSVLTSWVMLFLSLASHSATTHDDRVSPTSASDPAPQLPTRLGRRVRPSSVLGPDVHSSDRIARA